MKFALLLQISRLPNLLIVVLTQYFCRYFILEPVIKANSLDFFVSSLDFSLLVFSTVTITLAGYLINDYFDVETDEMNGKSKKALFVKKHSKRILWTHHALSALGVLLGLYVSYKVGNVNLTFIHFIAVTLLWFYSASYKKNVLVGNIVVAFLSALTLIIVWIYEFYAFKNGAHKISFNNLFLDLILAYALFAFIVSFLREFVKDIEDVEGDSKANMRTFPVKFGIRYSKLMFAFFLLAAAYLVIISEIWLYKHNFDKLFYYFAGIINALFVIFTWIFLNAKTKKQFWRAQQLLKVIMIVGLLSMILLPFYTEKLLN